jgi:hypothetical protein
MIDRSAALSLVLPLLLGCTGNPSPELPASEPPRPRDEDEAIVAEVRSIAKECAAKEAYSSAGYQVAPDDASVRRAAGSDDTWLIDMAEQEPYMGRLPPPAPPQRFVVQVHAAVRSCTRLPLNQ